MIEVFYKLSDIRFGELMCVYQEGNTENAKERYAKLDRNAAILQVEQDFYIFLEEVFFSVDDAAYYVLSENGKYLSALRLEPYEDGFLLEALETRPGFRRKGYAKKLVSFALDQVKKPVYSHVLKDNVPSLSAHFSCGFKKIMDSARYIDGTVSHACCTLLRK